MQIKKEDLYPHLKKICYIPTLNIGVVTWRIENYANELLKFKDDCIVHIDYIVDANSNIAWDKFAINHEEMSQKIVTKLEQCFDYFDFIIFQKIQNKEALILIEQLKKKYPQTKVIAEIDDAIGEVTPSNKNKFTYHHRYAAQHMIISDAIIASTQFLGESVREIVGNDKPIHVAPNCINIGDFGMCFDKKNINPLPKKETINLVYVGAGGHDEDLKLFIKPILNILNSRDDVRFIIRYGDHKPEFIPNHEFIDFKTNVINSPNDEWAIKNYLYSMYKLNANIGLAPLRDTQFNRCKSGIKWVEWSYLNVPLVASNVEAYKKINGSLYLTDNNSTEIQKRINIAIQSQTKRDFTFLKNQSMQTFNIKKECKRLLSFMDSL